MSFSFDILLLFLALGVFGGFLAGLLGVGGGMVIVPFLSMIFAWKGMDAKLIVHASVATSMAMIMFTSLSSMRAHHKQKAVLWRVAFSLAPGIIIGGLISGGVIFALINTAWLSLVFALFVGYSAFNMFRNKKPKPSRQLPGVLGLTGMGGVIGFISGLVGAGGGFLSVPFMTWCNISIRNAVATSASLGFPIAVANSAGYIISGIQKVGIHDGMLGYIYWPGLLALSCASVFMAPVGAKLAHTMPVAKLKKIFAVLLCFISIYMFYKSLQAFAVI